MIKTIDITENYEEMSNFIRAVICRHITTHGLRLAEDKREDVMQETFYRIFKNRDKYDPSISAPTTWISIITINCLRDAIEDNIRYCVYSSDNGSESSEPISKPMGRECSNHIIYDYDKIMEVIESLPKEKRRLVELMIDGTKAVEIADVLGWDVEKVYRDCCRARKALATKIGADYLNQLGIVA